MEDHKPGTLIHQSVVDFYSDLGQSTVVIKEEDVDVWLERRDVYWTELTIDELECRIFAIRT